MRRYSHVAVIGIDGMGSFNRFADTPNMDSVFKDGAYTYDAFSMDPTISAENWGGMLIGVEPAVHNLTNGYISVHPYESEQFPTAFRRIRSAYPDAVLASIVNWNPINIGIVEDGIGVIKQTADDDDLVVEKIVEVVKQKPDFLFVQLDNVDGAGHHYGYGEPGHIAEIEKIDGLFGKIYGAYKDEGIADDTLFICLADHGGHGRGHGGWAEGEKKIFFAAAGKGVKKGLIPYAVTKDISAVVLYAFGIDVPEYTPGGYTSQVPEGMFEDSVKKYVQPPETEPLEHRAALPFDAEGGLKEKFGDRISLCMNFENDLSDETGKCKIEENGSVKFYTNGVSGSAAEFGATGAFTAEGADFSGSFSVSFSLLADKDITEPICVMGSKSPERGKHQEKGFNLILRNHSIFVQYGCGDDDTDTVTSFGSDGFSGWIHVILAVNAETGETNLYLNFKNAHSAVIDRKYIRSLSGSGKFTVGDDIFASYNKSRGLIFRMDDLLLFNDCLTGADVDSLAEYYSGE